MKVFTQILVGIAVLLVCSFGVARAQTSLSVSANVGDTNITFIGKTTPNSQVTFTINGAVVGTTVSDVNGDFTKQLLDQPPGLTTFSIYSTDADGDSTVTINYSVSLTPLAETIVSNLVLPPIIKVKNKNVELDQEIKIYGKTVPNAAVTILIYSRSDKLKDTKTTTADSTGYFSITLEYDDLSPNRYKIRVQVSVNGYQSEFSEAINVLFADQDDAGRLDPLVPLDEATSDEANLQNLCPLLRKLRIFDENNDCRLSLNEFLSGVRIWYSSWKQKENQCDLNEDAKCNLIDFSILLYNVND